MEKWFPLEPLFLIINTFSKITALSTTHAFYYRIPEGVELADDGKNYSITKLMDLVIKTDEGEIKIPKSIKSRSENANEVDEMEDFGLDESDFKFPFWIPPVKFNKSCKLHESYEHYTTYTWSFIGYVRFPLHNYFY